MHVTTYPHRSRRHLAGSTVLAAASLLAACGSSEDSADAGSGVESQSTAAGLASPTSTGPGRTGPTIRQAEAALEVESAEAATFEIVIETGTDFEINGGTFEVTTGATELGCAAGTFEERPKAAHIEREWICGDAEGALIARFEFPREADDGGDALVSSWTFESGTGVFAGMTGSGDWLGEIDESGDGAAELWTGTAERGASTPSADPGGIAETDLSGPPTEERMAAVLATADAPDGIGTLVFSLHGVDADPLLVLTGSDELGTAPTTSDLYRVGSITKTVTSLAVMSLVDDGMLDLDDPAIDHLTRVAVPAQVTVRDLLGHTSGIPEYVTDDLLDLLEEDPDRAWTPEESIDLVTIEPDTQVGEVFAYSNTNYLLLGVMLEELTGQAYHEVVRARVFEPAGMTATYIAGAESGAAPLPGLVEGDDGELTVDERSYRAVATSAWAAGAMVASPDDLHRLFTAIGDGKIVSAAALIEMRGPTGNVPDYGLGLEGPALADRAVVGHGGRIPGFSTFVQHDLDTGRTMFLGSTSDALVWFPVADAAIELLAPGVLD